MEEFNLMGICIVSFQVHNVGFAFELMQDTGLPKPKARPEGKPFSVLDLFSLIFF